jgi:hypothetical protein
MYLIYKIRLKTWKLVKLNLTCTKLVKSIWFYKFIKFVIWIKLSLDLALKFMLTSFAKSIIYLKP